MDRRPIKVVWTGASFVPDSRDMAYCRQWFGAGEVLLIDPEQEQDTKSRGHYHASLHEAWINLPDRLMTKYPTETIFRKKLLIEAGFFYMDETVCDTKRDAATIAAFMAPLDRSAIIVVKGNVIRKYVAMSQSPKAMGKEEFQKSKWAVLDLAASLIKVTPKELERNAGKSA